jgi:hypothetical protein
MGSNPINLALRFLLELVALFAISYWATQQAEGIVGLGLGALAFIGAAAVWGTLAVPDDPSRSGNAPVPVPGLVRLILELGVFGAGALALYGVDNAMLALIMAVVVLIHYAISYDRIQWLLQQ